MDSDRPTMIDRNNKGSLNRLASDRNKKGIAGFQSTIGGNQQNKPISANYRKKISSLDSDHSDQHNQQPWKEIVKSDRPTIVVKRDRSIPIGKRV